MAKGKVKTNRSAGSDAPQLRSLRKRKGDCPSDELLMSDDVSFYQPDTGENNISVTAALPQSPLQELTMISVVQGQGMEQSSLIKQDASIETKVEGTGVYLENEAFKGEEETTVNNPHNHSELESLRLHTEDNTTKNGKDKEEIEADECNLSQTFTDQQKFFLPTSEEADGSCAAALDELDTSENIERGQETSQDEHSNVCIGKVKEVVKKAVEGFPAEKKRRMGTCGLTEMERCHFLQTNKRGNGQNGTEGIERQINNDKDHLISLLSLPFSHLHIPVTSIVEPREGETHVQASVCEPTDRAETEVHIGDTTADGTDTVCNPGCSDRSSYEAEGGRVPGPEQSGDSKFDTTADKDELHLGNPNQQGADCSPAITSYTNPSINEENEKKDWSDATALQMCIVTIATDEKREETRGDAGDREVGEAGASAADTQRGGFHNGSVQHCEAAVPSGGSEKKGSCGPDDEPCTGPPAVNTENPPTGENTDSFGSEFLDYVSDSQLNNIDWIDDEVMERDVGLGSSDCNEDATELICGLIRELSSLNRTVMATHRELENLRRGSKSSRNSRR